MDRRGESPRSHATRYSRPAMKWTVGPLAPAVYWRRRAAVGILVLVLLLVIAVLASSSGSDGSDGASKKTTGSAVDQPRSSSSPSSSPSPDNQDVQADCSIDHPCNPRKGPSPTADGQSGQTKNLADGENSVPVSGEDGAPMNTAANADLSTCSDADLVLAIVVAHQSYPVDSRFKIQLTITNNSDHACQRDVGPGQQEIYVKAGDQRIWSSDDCSQDQSQYNQAFAPKERRTYWISWTTLRSAPGCPKDQVNAGPGDYAVVGRLATHLSPEVKVSLEQS